MAIIPISTRFIGISDTVNLTERKSATVNKETEPYTLQDFIDSVGGGRLEGTLYVFVAANGTDLENGAELQAAYDLAKGKVDFQVSTQPYIPSYFFYDEGYLEMDFQAYVEFGGSPIESNVVYELLFDGVSYFASFNGSDWNFVDNIYPPGNGYTTLEILVPIITYNLVTVVAAPGKYSFESDFLVNTDYVSIVSLTGNADVLFTGAGTINVTANDILLKGIDTQDKPFTIATDLDLLVVENCTGGEFSFGGDATFGGNPINLSSTFINCEGGNYSFGYFGEASGIFTNCVSKIDSFGSRGVASGIFTNCKGQKSSFGDYGVANGTFIDCEIVKASEFEDPFGGFGLTAGGYFENCKGGYSSFGKFTGGSAGTFINCTGGGNSFSGLCSGVYTNCDAGTFSFGYSGIAGGTFTNCVAGEKSFGGNGSTVGQLIGKLFYCRLTSGTFQTVSGAGRTYYCVDGNGNTNNQ